MVENSTVENASASTSSATPSTNAVQYRKVKDATFAITSAKIGDPSKRNIHDYISVVLPKGNMAEKLKNAAPYNFFLTTITSSPATHHEPLSVTLQGISFLFLYFGNTHNFKRFFFCIFLCVFHCLNFRNS